MWKSLVRGTEGRQIVDLASPSFFDVLPGKALRRATGTLSKAWFDRDGFAEARAHRAETLDRADLGVRLGEPEAHGAIDRETRGQRLLALYFHQLYAGGPVLLDLRPERFEAGIEQLRWNPKPLWYRFDEDFLGAMREIYAGFYAGDDARFEAGLDRVDLRCAEGTFLQHFGAGDQRAVAFDVASFTETFHQTFLSCRDGGASLHRDFIPLGLYLATLYVHLEELGGTFDVRAAFDRIASV